MVTGCRGTGIEPEKNEWLEATRELVGEMCELARNKEAVRWFTSNAGLLDGIRKMGEGTYDRPRKGWVAEVSEEELLKGVLALSETGFEKEETREIPKVLHKRLNPSVLISAFQAIEQERMELAAYTILTTSKTYVRPGDWRENMLVVLDYGGEYAVAAAFWESGAKTVTGSVSFMRAEVAAKLCEVLEEWGVKKGAIRRLSEDDLRGKSL